MYGCAVSLQTLTLKTVASNQEGYKEPEVYTKTETKVTKEQAVSFCGNPKALGCTYRFKTNDGKYHFEVYYTSEAVLRHERLHIKRGPCHLWEYCDNRWNN